MSETICKPFKREISLSFDTLGLLGIRFFSKPDVLGVYLLFINPKSRDASHSSGKGTRLMLSFPIVCCCAGAQVFGETISLPPTQYCSLSMLCCGETAHLVFRYPLEGNDLCIL